MPQPTTADVHVSVPLTNISVAYMQEGPSVAERMFPRVNVTKQANKYYIYSKNDFNRVQMEKRGPGTESAGSGWTMTTSTYYCDVFALHKDIDDQTRGNVDAPLDLDRDAAKFLAGQAKLKWDKQWATDFFAASIWTGSTTGADITVGTVWSTSGSTPIEDVAAQQTSIMKKTGKLANKLLIGAEVFSILRNHASVLDRIKYTSKGVVTAELLAQIFNVEEVIIGWTMETTSVEGATGTQGFIFGKHALLVYAPSSPSLMEPSGGYTFVWNFPNSNQGQSISKFRMDKLKSDRLEIEFSFDCKQTAADVGVFFASCVA